MTTRTERLAAGLLALGCDRLTDDCFAYRKNDRQRVYWLDSQGGVRVGSSRRFARRLPREREHRLLVLGEQAMKAESKPGLDCPERFVRGAACALVVSVPLWGGIIMLAHWALA